MKIISWDKAYSIFPDTTFNERKTYQLRPLDDYFGPLIAKYSRRGWRTLELVWEEDKQRSKSIEASCRRLGDLTSYKSPCRRLGDQLSWKIALDTAGVAPGLPVTVLKYSCFDITRREERYEDYHEDIRNPHYEIKAIPFKSCVLKHGYLYSGQQKYLNIPEEGKVVLKEFWE